MPNQENLEAVKIIDEKIKQSQNLLFIDYAGLNVADQTTLRQEAKKIGGEFTVQKNTLVALTLKQNTKDLPDTVYAALNGPTAVIYGYEDAVGVTKLAVSFAKDHEDAFKIKAGVLTGTADTPYQALDIDGIKKLATLPGRDELRAKLVGTLNAPISGLVNVMAGNLRGLVQVLNARKQQLATSN